MDFRTLKEQFIKVGVETNNIPVIFRTPDCSAYYNVNCHIVNINNKEHLMIDLVDNNDKNNDFYMDKENWDEHIEPKFKVGDVVCNVGGLYPNFKCTIAEVNEELHYYSYKEVNGRTYFEHQDKLKLVSNIKPKFKAGDRVKNVSSEYPDKIFVINIVNTNNECYHYFNSKGIITKFKDQDKLILVKDDEVPPPVEDEDKLDILAKAHADNVKYNVLKYDIEHYPLIYNVLKQIIAISKEGGISYRLIVPMKVEVDESGVSYEEDDVCGIIRWHFDKLGYKVEEKVNINHNEFFISW